METYCECRWSTVQDECRMCAERARLRAMLSLALVTKAVTESRD